MKTKELKQKIFWQAFMPNRINRKQNPKYQKGCN